MRPIQITAAVFAIFIGLAMLLMWIVFLITGQVPEWNARPVETSLHLTAEVLTAFTLIAAGTGLLTRQVWGRELYLVSMGMLIYSVIQAAGYFAQQGQITFIGMFAVFAILAVMFTVVIIFDSSSLAETTSMDRWRAS